MAEESSHSQAHFQYEHTESEGDLSENIFSECVVILESDNEEH